MVLIGQTRFLLLVQQIMKSLLILQPSDQAALIRKYMFHYQI